MSRPSADAVHEYLSGLQSRICDELENRELDARFEGQEITTPEGGVSRPRVLSDGRVLERASVAFTHSKGPQLPPAATERRPELAGRGFEAVSMSLIVHPCNPYAPTTHANLRFFLAESEDADPVWWFGGGFDLTPYYGFEDDCVHWHRSARDACEPFGAELYPRFKKACDDYFYLPHRSEPRGIGGLFFDDFDELGFERSFELLRSVGDAFLVAYLPILERRKDVSYGQREREFQLYRRGRYVEFNLLYDRGTRYGLQSGRRVESVLSSMPPLVAWRPNWTPEPDSAEARLYADFLTPKPWT